MLVLLCIGSAWIHMSSCSAVHWVFNSRFEAFKVPADDQYFIDGSITSLECSIQSALFGKKTHTLFVVVFGYVQKILPLHGFM